MEYPRNRSKHFAHKLVRLMLRTCAMQEIGQDGFSLVSAIAHTEDAKRYAAAVTYWNDQLIPILGMTSWGQLHRARKKAIAHGWLHYEPGCRGSVGRYWSLVPTGLLGQPDGAADEDFTTEHLSSIENGAQSVGNVERKARGMWSAKRGECGEPSYPAPNPSPSPSPSTNGGREDFSLQEKLRQTRMPPKPPQ